MAFAFIRLCFTHASYVAYYCVLFWKLHEVLENTEWKEDDTIITAVVLCIGFAIVQLILLIKAYRSSDDDFLRNNTWFHVPMFTFISFALGPYGMFLDYQYDALHKKQVEVVKNCTITPSEIILQRDNFIVLQAAIPMLAITFLIYPYPVRQYRKGEIFAIAIEFLNAFDILDMVEDISAVQNHSTWLKALFYLSIGISTILLAFPAGLEDEDDDDPKCIRVISTLCTWIFTDLMFCIIRITVISSGSNYQTGFHFLMKNILALMIRPFLLCYGARD